MSISPVERNLYRDSASGIYIVRKFKKGKRPLYESTGERALKAARAKRDVIISRWLGSERKGKRIDFRDLFDEVVKIKETKSWKTGQSAELHVRRHLKPWFETQCAWLDEFNEATWERYILAQREKSKTRLLKHDREILVFTLTLARKKGLISKIFELRKPDARRTIGRYVEDSEVERLLQASPTGDLVFQILIAAKMGMRLREILHLGWDRVDLARGFITLNPENVKTQMKRVVPIHADLADEFARRFGERKKLWLFPSPHDGSRPVDSNKSAWMTAMRESGVKCRFHDLRHKAITDMLAAGIPSPVVSKITGASEQVMQRIYHHLRADDLERVRRLNCGKFVGDFQK